jgi:hypothetical protein
MPPAVVIDSGFAQQYPKLRDRASMMRNRASSNDGCCGPRHPHGWWRAPCVFSPMTSKQANLHKTGIDFDLALAQEFGNTFAGLSRSF